MKKCSYCGQENEEAALQCAGCGTDRFASPTASAPPVIEPSRKYFFPPLTPTDMALDWVTLVKCRNLVEADLVRCQLEGAGVAAFIPDEFLMQAISWNLNAYGYVRVQVTPQDYEAAQGILSFADLLDEPGPNGPPDVSNSREA